MLNGRDIVILTGDEARQLEHIVHRLLHLTADTGKKGWQRRWYKMLKEADPQGLLEEIRREGDLARGGDDGH